MDQLPQQLIIGLSVGATYALIALGYTMVYGVLRLINFAHGEVYMVGAVSGFYLSGWLLPLTGSVWLTLPLVFIGAMLICTILAWGIEFFAYRPLRSQPRLIVLITAIGVSLLLQNVVQLSRVFGPTPRSYPEAIKAALSAQVWQSAGGRVSLTRLDILSLMLSLALMSGLTWIVMKTRTGMALRAVSFRVDTASLMGINTNRIISVTFMFGSALASVAGVLDGIRYNVHPLMGVVYGLKAFVAAVLGGIGSIPGALVGGLLIGLTETFVKTYLSSAYADAASFVILILILLVKPTGLFGRHAPEKV